MTVVGVYLSTKKLEMEIRDSNACKKFMITKLVESGLPPTDRERVAMMREKEGLSCPLDHRIDGRWA